MLTKQSLNQQHMMANEQYFGKAIIMSTSGAILARNAQSAKRGFYSVLAWPRQLVS